MEKSYQSIEENEIDLFELIQLLINSWKTILAVTIFCTGLVIFYAFNSPEIYKAEALIAPAQEQKSGASSALSQFSGLAAIAGVNIPSNTDIDRVLATLKTRKFLKKFIEDKNLLPIIFSEFWNESSRSWIIKDGHNKFTIKYGVKSLQGAIELENDKPGLIILSVSWSKPDIAALLATELVKKLNEQLREKAIADSQRRVGYLEQELAKTTLQDMRAVLYNLLESEKQQAMLANVNEDFALEVIDPAVVPEHRDKPKRKFLVILGVVCGVFLGVFAVFFRQFLQKLKFYKPSSK